MAGRLKWARGFAGLGAMVLLAVCVACLIPGPCEAGEKGQEKALVSMDVKNETLRNVLQVISKASGYEITVTGESVGRRLSLKLVDASLERALKEVIAAVGKPNHAILTDAAKREIEILILGESPGAGGKEVALVQQKPFDPMEVEVIPPEREGERGLTRREVEEMQKQQKPLNPDDVEVIPPEREGERGLTRREVEAIRKQHEPLDRGRVEVIPPEGGDERGLTRAEVKEAMELQRAAGRTE